MDTLKTVTLPSGAVLKFNPASFSDARTLYQAVLDELRTVTMQMDLELDSEVPLDLLKNLFCVGAGSKKIEAALWACFKRAKYNGGSITDETFEPVEARQDYIAVCVAVAKENIAPFAKSLFAEYGPLLSSLTKAQASRPETTT